MLLTHAQLRITRSNHTPITENMNIIGNNIIQNSLIMSDKHNTHSRIFLTRNLNACATILRESISRPESISSRIATLGCTYNSCNSSRRFFSPPEKPSLRPLARKAGSIDNCSHRVNKKLLKISNGNVHPGNRHIRFS